MALAGAVVSNPTAKNTTWRSGLRLGEVQRVERRVDDAHVAALGFGVEQALRRAGHAQHVAERAEDHFRAARDGDGFVDQLNGGYADGAAGTVHQLDFARQQVFQAALDDGVGLAAADFHDRPRAGDFLPDGLRELLGRAFWSRYSLRNFTEFLFHRAQFLPGTRRRAGLRLRR